MLLQTVGKGFYLGAQLMLHHRGGYRECLVRSPPDPEDKAATSSCRRCLQTSCRSGTHLHGTES